MSCVVIHPNPDLDACTCVALDGADAEHVHFIPADYLHIPRECPCCGEQYLAQEKDLRILDHPIGQKGRLDADGTRHAAACSMPEAASADPKLLAEVDEKDSTGIVRQPRFGLDAVLSAIRTEASERGLRQAALDREVVAVMSRIIRGINLLWAAHKEAKTVIAVSRIETIGGFRIAVLPKAEISPEVGIVLNDEHDVSGAIYAQGFNLGVTRYPGRERPDLRKLEQFLSGWFVHTAGFLACWGSRKAPATKPPPAGTPQTQDELLALMRKVFGSANR